MNKININELLHKLMYFIQMNINLFYIKFNNFYSSFPPKLPDEEVKIKFKMLKYLIFLSEISFFNNTFFQQNLCNIIDPKNKEQQLI